MAAGAIHNTNSTLNANYKEIYGDSIDNVIPETAILSKEIPFSQADKLGDKYIMPVMLSHEGGVTYLGSNAGVSDLNAVRAAVYKEAQVDSSSTVLRASLSYSAADKMASSKQSFINWSEMLFGNMAASIAKRNEIDFLYGQLALGTVSAGAAGPTTTFTLTLSDFCDGIWAGMETNEVDVWSSTAFTTQRNNSSTNPGEITAVDFSAGTVALSFGSNVTISNGDVLVWRGAVAAGPVYNAMVGIDKIITTTSSVFNISPSTYGLWKGHSVSAGSSALTLSKIFSGIARPIALGLAEEVLVLVNPKTYANLNSAESSLRRYDSSYSQSKNDAGSEELCFYSGNGKLRVKSHIYVKPTEAFAIPVKQMKRLGTTDVTFKLPKAAADGDVFLHIPDKAGYEVRCRSDQAIFSKKPAWMLKFTSIVNS